jgi:hypothetical protein
MPTDPLSSESPPGAGLVAWLRVLGWLAVAAGVLVVFWSGVAASNSEVGDWRLWIVPGVQGIVGGSLLLACAAIVERLNWIAVSTDRAARAPRAP